MAWNDIFAFRVVLFTLCLSIDVDSQNRPPVSVAFFLLVQSAGHPPHSSASPVELRLRVGPRALSGKKKEVL
jgi:hypothetical protein